MPDFIDRSVKEQYEELQLHIDAARHVELPGPHTCVKCGEHNERWQEGYAVCGSCVEESK